MAKQIDKTVLDFGSSRISILIGGRGVNNTFVISGSAETEYDGFCDGEFLEPGQLKSKLEQVVLAAEESVKGQISEIYVGVPGDSMAQDRYMAERFGFRQYRPAEQIGYWLFRIKL